MKYLNSQPFSVNGTGKVMEGTCERCVFGSGKHQPECPELVNYGAFGTRFVKTMETVQKNKMRKSDERES